MAWLEKILARDAPRKKKRHDVAGYVVRAQPSGHIVHHEIQEVGHLSDEAVGDGMFDRREQLEAKYPPDDYEVEAGLFNNLSAFYHFFPELKTNA